MKAIPNASLMTAQNLKGFIGLVIDCVVEQRKLARHQVRLARLQTSLTEPTATGTE